jgi:hypothetical protein
MKSCKKIVRINLAMYACLPANFSEYNKLRTTE